MSLILTLFVEVNAKDAVKIQFHAEGVSSPYFPLHHSYRVVCVSVKQLKKPAAQTKKRKKKLREKFLPLDLTQQRHILEKCMGCFYFSAWFGPLEIKPLLLSKFNAGRT